MSAVTAARTLGVAGGFFVAMIYPVKCRKCGQRDEIEKPMRAKFPHCASCGGELKHIFIQAPAIVFDAPGFYSTDIGRLRSQMSAERYAQFEHERDDIQRRAKAGRLTNYEKALEAI